jgi:hypothetical protein
MASHPTSTQEDLMSTTTPATPGVAPPPASNGAMSALTRFRTDPGYQAFLLLRIGFTVAPIFFGADKFSNVLVNWEKYLAPWIRDASPLSATHTMYVVG